MNRVIETVNMGIIKTKNFVWCKINNEEGNYMVGAIIGICILIIAVISQIDAVKEFVSTQVTKLTTWGNTEIEKVIN